MSSVKVAALQYRDEKSQDQMKKKIAAMVRAAALGGARLIVLPERSFNGSKISTIDEAIEHAQTSDSGELQFMSELALDNACYIAFGYVELNEGGIYDSAALVDPAGSIVAKTRKHNLHRNEHVWAMPGDDPSPVAMTPFGRVGLLISGDSRNLYRESHPFYGKRNVQFYKKGSVDIVAVPCSATGKTAGPLDEWIQLAEELDAAVVVANRIGSVNEGEDCFGSSTIVDRKLNVQSTSDSSQSILLVKVLRNSSAEIEFLCSSILTCLAACIYTCAMNSNFKFLIESYVKHLLVLEATPKPKGFFDLPPGFTDLTPTELKYLEDDENKLERKHSIKRGASHGHYSKVEDDAFDEEVEELRAMPEFESFETFVNYKLDNDEEEFSAAELQALARNYQSAIAGRNVEKASTTLTKDIKAELLKIGFKFVARENVKGFRGSMSSAHGSNPFAGTGGGGSGFSSGDLKLGGGSGAIGGKRAWGTGPGDLTMGTKKK